MKAEKEGATTIKTFVITVQRDTDGDGKPDITDPDDDGDGFTDVYREIRMETENQISLIQMMMEMALQMWKRLKKVLIQKIQTQFL